MCSAFHSENLLIDLLLYEDYDEDRSIIVPIKIVLAGQYGKYLSMIHNYRLMNLGIFTFRYSYLHLLVHTNDITECDFYK